jgi:hypothetical protein
MGWGFGAMKNRIVALVVLAVFGLVVGFILGWSTSFGRERVVISRTVAMSWGDGKYGPAFYEVIVKRFP